MALDRYIWLNCLIKWCFILPNIAVDSQCYSHATCGSVSLNVSSNHTLKLFSQSGVSLLIASRDFTANVCLAEANVVCHTVDFGTELGAYIRPREQFGCLQAQKLHCFYRSVAGVPTTCSATDKLHLRGFVWCWQSIAISSLNTTKVDVWNEFLVWLLWVNSWKV